jgi:hypothetical protein
MCGEAASDSRPRIASGFFVTHSRMR